MNTKVEFILSVFISILVVGSVIVWENDDQILLQMNGDTESNQVTPIMTCGKLLAPVLIEKPWVRAYTIGYANSTNQFYIRYEFTYFYAPHKLQYTKWQTAPQAIIAVEWETIELFAGSWLPDRAYPFDSEIVRFG